VYREMQTGKKGCSEDKEKKKNGEWAHMILKNNFGGGGEKHPICGVKTKRGWELQLLNFRTGTNNQKTTISLGGG